MKKIFLFAASALMLAACSNEADAPKNVEENLNEDILTLTTLDPSSQAGRIKTFSETRGDKSERLTLVAKIAPVSTAAAEKWSATGIDFSGGNVYVSWHSDRQASDPATKWGGALDLISTDAGGNMSFGNTWTSNQAKFNNVVADGNVLYLPLTDAKKGAAVARVTIGSENGPIRKLSGNSANALEIKADGKIIAVTGYSKGGVFSIDKDFPAFDEKNPATWHQVDTLTFGEDFGGKYVVGNYVLRTDEEAAYIYCISEDIEYNIGAPLLSELKHPEKVESAQAGDEKRVYGKHTMAIDGDYFYVAGGQVEREPGEDYKYTESLDKNGLRVYQKTANGFNHVGGNATNTTAVCVHGDYVYAATGAGLRVYKKFADNKLELFAFEVKRNANGSLMKDEDGNLIAGTDAHSCNFVKVYTYKKEGKDGEDDKYIDRIYMANGQSGVYVFDLDVAAPAQEGTVAD